MRRYGKWIGLAGGLFILAALFVNLLSTFPAAVEIILLAIGIMSLVIYGALNLTALRQQARRRSTKLGANAVLATLFLLVILVLINFVGNRHHLRVDTTEAKEYSLSPQSKKILSSLDKELEFKAFYKSGTELQAQDLLTEYSDVSPRVRYTFIDPDQEPGVAKKYDIRSYGTIVVEYGQNSEKVESVSEEDLTNAIIKVTRPTQKKVCFVTGHAEKDIQSSAKGGYSNAREAIEGENYLVESVLLADKSEIPSDCSVLVIAGPEKPYLKNELDMIEQYLDRGGKALFMIDPEESPELVGALGGWGFDIGNNIVVDASNVGRLFGAGPELPIVVTYPPHEITRGLNGQMTLFPLVRSVNPEKDLGEGLAVRSLAQTQQRSWAETKFDNKVQFNEREDTRGPISIAAVGTKEIEVTNGANHKAADGDTLVAKKARLVVFGDSDFASNEYFHFVANGDLFLNTISWLAEEEDLISIRPKSTEDRRLYLTETQSKMILIFGVILLPMSILGMAISAYNKRR